jgi:hypothetical protein
MSQHHRMIRALVNALRESRGEVESLSAELMYAQDAAATAQRKASRLADDAHRAQQDAEIRQYERERALSQLEHARRYGNEYEARRAVERLKRPEW